MKRHVLLVGCIALAVAGCAKGGASPDRQAKAEAKAARQAEQTPPAGSKLAKVTPGMKEADVESVLGKADDEVTYETGKRWMPYNFGGDARREVWAYKGVGRVVFHTNNAFKGNQYVVHHVEHDPDEDGTAARKK